MLEDATDSIEFFVKDKLNLKVFDVFQVSGYKDKYLTIEELIKLDIEKFRAKVKNS